jgi:fibronectin-binding autotransporter adhesin
MYAGPFGARDSHRPARGGNNSWGRGYRPRLEALEDRTAPATLTWQGDLNGNWGAGTVGVDTNWDTNTLPQSGDILFFSQPPGANKTNTNDIPNLDLLELHVFGPDYVVNVNSLTVESLSIFGGTVDSGFGVLTLNGNVTAGQSFSGASAVLKGGLALGALTRTFTVGDSAGVADDLVIDAIVEGTGGLVKAGAGRMRLNAANTYVGATAVNAGSLALGVNEAIANASALNIAGGATLALNDFQETVGSLNGGGNLVLDSGDFITGAANTSTTFSGAITGSESSAFRKVGTGTLTLSGNSTEFSGAFNVDGGTVWVNANLDNCTVTVGAGGTLGGTGPTGPITVANGGVLSPGASAGTLSTIGSVALTTGSIIRAEINGTTAGTSYDRLSTMGAVDLDGATLDLRLNFVSATGNTYTIVTTSGGVSGTFNGLPDSTAIPVNGRLLQVHYAATDVVLTDVGAPNSATTVTTSKNPTSFGEPVVFTAAVAPNGSVVVATGTVTFVETTTNTSLGTISLDGAGAAKLTVASLPVGNRTIVATYNGGNYTPSAGSVNQVINPGVTSTVLGASSNPALFGQALQFNATVAPTAPSTLTPSGSVTFVDTTTAQTLGSANLNAAGVATLQVALLSVGAHSISATFQPGDGYAGSNGLLAQTVNSAITTTTVTPSVNPSPMTRAVLFVAHVAASGSVMPTGSVRFLVDGVPATSPMVLDPTGQAIFAPVLPLGMHTISASYTSDSVSFVNGTATPFVERIVLPRFVAVGNDRGTPLVQFFDSAMGHVLQQMFAFAPTSHSGVRVAIGDVNGDGTPDVICAAGAGAPPIVEVIDGTKLNQLQSNGQIADSALLGRFLAFGPTTPGGVFVATGDVNADGRADVVVSMASGRARVVVVDGGKLGQVQPNGDIAGSALFGSFFPYAASFTGGVSVAAGDVNGDGRADVITAPAYGSQRVEVIDAGKLGWVRAGGQIAVSAFLGSFFAFSPSFAGGVTVAAGDLNGDHRADVICGMGPGAAPRYLAVDAERLDVRQANGQIGPAALLVNALAFSSAFHGGVRVAAVNVAGDDRLEILVGTGPTALGLGGVRALDALNLRIVLALFVDYDGVQLGGA